MNVPAFHVAVFARAPVPGAVKTRLIPLLGPEGAARAHRAMVQRTLRTAAEAGACRLSLWAADDDPTGFLDRCARLSVAGQFGQVGADLGEKMAHGLQALLEQHESVLLVGTDCPALSASDLRLAARALENGAHMVFTPAEDGGYVLVGARSSIPRAQLAHVFSGIEWGTQQVMSQTRQRLAENGWRHGVDYAEMPARWDVDEPADYRRAQAEGLL